MTKPIPPMEYAVIKAVHDWFHTYANHFAHTKEEVELVQMIMMEIQRKTLPNTSTGCGGDIGDRNHKWWGVKSSTSKDSPSIESGDDIGIGVD